MFQTVVKVQILIFIIKFFVTIIGMSKKTLIVIIGYPYYDERVVPTKCNRD